MDKTAALVLVELAKLSLQSYFAQMQLAGKSEEEINQMYEDVMKEFEARDPSKLIQP